MLVMALGLSYKTAPLALLERLVFPARALPEALGALRQHCSHGVILSTCNRVEVYALVGHHDSGRRALLRFLCDYHRCSPAEIEPYCYVLTQAQAVGHLFRVAAGLDSMMLGETQILGQVRAAYAVAQEHGAPGAVLARLFRQALEVGKRAHRETRICQSAVSLSAAAVELARTRLGDLRRHTALLVGAGETSRLAAHTLQAYGAGRVLVINRTYERARALAAAVGGEALPLDALGPALADADVVITSTGAGEYLVPAPTVRAAMAARPDRPLYCIDVAIPRDIDPAAAELPNVHVYNLADLQQVELPGAGGRASDVQAVQQIVEEEVARFFQWWDEREVVPTIAALRARAEAIRQAELAKALSRLGPLGERERETLDALTQAIVNKLLHAPTVRLKERAGDNDGRRYVPAVRALFQLDA
jgi:glutamyl-tRNA reductase